MKLILVDDKKMVENFLLTASGKSGAEFLASLEWAEILKDEELVQTLAVSDDHNILAIFNSIKKDFKFGLSYYYLPRGPVFADKLSETEQNLVWQYLISEFKKRGAVFLRVEPKNILPNNFKFLASINLQPKETLLLDLALSSDELLKSFHPKTRYNIKLAEKKGVTVVEADGEKDFDNFWSLMSETGDRDGFKIHNKNHYRTLATANPDFIKLFVAKSNDAVIAAGLFSFFGDKVTYLHGASAYNYRQLMAPYLLQWTVISKAKNQGYKYYDFYGIDEKKWPGVTRFKAGFGGFKINYAGTYDIILNSFAYNFYKILRRLRRLF